MHIFYGQLVSMILCLQHSVSSNQTAAAAAAEAGGGAGAAAALF